VADVFSIPAITAQTNTVIVKGINRNPTMVNPIPSPFLIWENESFYHNHET